MFSSGKKT
jgi:voltage-dependent calcium channel T type alpha-1G